MVYLSHWIFAISPLLSPLPALRWRGEETRGAGLLRELENGDWSTTIIFFLGDNYNLPVVLGFILLILCSGFFRGHPVGQAFASPSQTQTQNHPFALLPRKFHQP